MIWPEMNFMRVFVLRREEHNTQQMDQMYVCMFVCCQSIVLTVVAVVWSQSLF